MTDEAKSYKTAGAFRTALEARWQLRARETGTDLQRFVCHLADKLGKLTRDRMAT
jgi:hypothetical protein